MIDGKVTGPHRANVIAFARRRRSAWAIVVVPRLTASLSAGLSWPVGERFWETTTIVLPKAAPAEWAHVVARGGTPARGRVSVASALSDLPLALMSAVPNEGGSRHGDRPLKDPLAYDDRPT